MPLRLFVGIPLLVPLGVTIMLLLTLAERRTPHASLLRDIERHAAFANKTALETNSTVPADTPSAFVLATMDALARERAAASQVRLLFLVAVVTWMLAGIGPYRELLPAAQGKPPAGAVAGIRLQKQA
jgi:hypothetical protein